MRAAPSPSDNRHGWIWLRALRAPAVRVGLLPEEMGVGQPLELCIGLWAPVAEATPEDSLPSSVPDYRAIAACARRVLAAQHHRTVEALAERLARALLDKFAVPHVYVSVDKPAALPDACAGVAIERSAAAE